MPSSNRLQFDTLTNFDASTLNATFQAVNGTGNTESLRFFKLYNSSADLIILSFNGVDEHDFITPGGSFILDVQSNSDGTAGGRGDKQLAKNTIVYAKTSSNTDRLIMAGYY